MPPLPKQKLERLKRLFTEKAMVPGQAAKEIGVTYATAKRYYEKWSDEIKRSLESRLIPAIEESIKQLGKTRPRGRSKVGSQFGSKRS